MSARCACNGDVRPERQLHGHDAIENGGAHALRIATQVMLRDPRAIGNRIEIQLRNIPTPARTASRSRTATLVV